MPFQGPRTAAFVLAGLTALSPSTADTQGTAGWPQ